MANLITLRNAEEMEPHHFCTEASAIGLRPGEPFPPTLRTTLGNGMPFHRKGVDEDAAYYEQQLGCTLLIVYND